MNTLQAQIKVNIPVTMKAYLQSRADKFGMPIAGYLKHLILKDIEAMDYPTYQASEATEKAYKKAREEDASGETIKVNDSDTFLDEL